MYPVKGLQIDFRRRDIRHGDAGIVAGKIQAAVYINALADHGLDARLIADIGLVDCRVDMC